MSDVGPGRAIRICDGEEVLWERKRPAKPVKVTSAKVSLGKTGLKVSWETTGAKRGENPDVWLQWSADGARWNGLTVGLTGKTAEVDPSSIPADEVRIRVLVHDGYATGSAETEPVRLPKVAPELAIIHPADSQILKAGRPLHLWGTSTGPGTPKSVEWYLDGKKVAEDLDAWAKIPKAGDHVAELRAKGASPVKAKFSVAEGHGRIPVE